MKKDELYYMRLAMNLAVRARGLTSPNPMVGALVVKNGKIISRGFHKKAGSAHAEVCALDKAGEAAKDATLYVTLEPCTHFGRTPPCVDKIIKSKVREVVVGMIDPNPINNGKGIKILQDNGINVRVGFLEKELKELNAPFIKFITKGLPYITVKVGQSLDGKIATSIGESQWITSDLARNYSHKLRGTFDAIMVGVNTVIRDNPRLEAWESMQQPIKIIVDSQLSTPKEAVLFTNDAKVIIVSLPALLGQETENRSILAKKAKIIKVKEKFGQINLRAMLKKLAQMEITNIIVEGGGTLIGSLFDEGLVDKVLFFIAPKIIGGKEAISSVMGKGVQHLDKVINLTDLKVIKFNQDFLVEAFVKK